MAKKKSSLKKLEEKLSLKKESAWKGYKTTKKVMDFGDAYKTFLDASKTERDCAKSVVKQLKKSGFKDMSYLKSAKKGDKLYLNYKEKVVAALVVGRDMSRFNLVGSHMDSPRLDLKQSPLYEDSSVALFKSHYYGGIKKYQWVNLKLAMHGIAYTKQGKKVEFSYGEKADEPKFVIPDLLPHLARHQMEKNAREFIGGEDLNIVVGNIPVDDKDVKDKIKLNVLQILNKNFGITEEDFSFAEINFVPAENSVDVGFDRGMIGAYGQDDKVCVYTSLRAIIEIKNPSATAVSYFTDKEEIGSDGDTGAKSRFLLNLAEKYASLVGINNSPSNILMNSKAISADVSALVNPNFSDVHEKRNASYIGNGLIMEKYTGSGGKYSANDASAEYLSEIRKILVKENISWQTGELGKIDIGGGGTIAKFLSSYGMDTLDAGPGVIAMHSPLELTSKVDVYEAYRFYKAFFN
ncbi:aminopeptidase [archaeon]|jgi:aspartyl aminopeptidase|nr:aminopeptidase [archaeon]MBT4351910.1 aminopeptidase [archaeon]MBT4648187.1 aminopeptidase [archaeon]MBT6821007.1 aminopeptidase [archaeon]MBT7391638.1 aminopeptidase [archaeon]